MSKPDTDELSELDWLIEEIHGNYDAEKADRLCTLIDQKVQQAIRDHYARQEAEIRICGKSVDEIVVILNALELERIEDLKMTMSNLDEWIKRVRADQHKATQRALDKTMQYYTSQLTPQAEQERSH